MGRFLQRPWPGGFHMFLFLQSNCEGLFCQIDTVDLQSLRELVSLKECLQQDAPEHVSGGDCLDRLSCSEKASSKCGQHLLVAAQVRM